MVCTIWFFLLASLIQVFSSGDKGGTVPISQNNNFSCSKWWAGVTTKSESDTEITKKHFMHKATHTVGACVIVT